MRTVTFNDGIYETAATGKYIPFIVTLTTKSPVSMTTLPFIAELPPDLSVIAEKTNKCYMATSCKVIWVFQVLIYSVCDLNNFVVRVSLAKDLTAFSVFTSVVSKAIVLVVTASIAEVTSNLIV